MPHEPGNERELVRADLERIFHALEVAARAHDGQYRKSANRTPYVSHCAAVGFFLHDRGYPLPVVLAGILHDVLEDTDLGEDDVARDFGDEVLALVRFVTEPSKRHGWDHRKQVYADQLRTAPPEAKAISAADKIHNIGSLTRSLREGEAIFTRMSRGPDEQVRMWRHLVESLAHGWTHPLLRELEATLDDLVAELRNS